MKFSLIILSALLMGLSQQPIGCGFLAWFSLLPLIKFLDTSNLLKEKIKIGILWGFIYHLSVVYWLFFNIGITKFSGFLSLIAATSILTVNTILIVIIYSIVKNHTFSRIYYSLPLIWVSIEYIRTFSFLGFPWVSISNSQAYYHLLI